MPHIKDEYAKGDWVTFRPEIKVLDCTVRDGGLMNDHRFDDEFVRAVYRTNVAAGVDYMEFGYKASKKIYSRDKYGDWKFCDEDYIRRIVGENPTDMKLTVMADAERTDYHTDILPSEESVLDVIRVACYIHQIPLALDMVKDAVDKGYETTLNLMAVSVVQERELEEALVAIAKSPINALYLVDSYGAFYSEQVRDLTIMYQNALAGTGKDVGYHGHNNQMLAYANTIEACIVGANMLDATIDGLGRGAGNCPMELLLGFLKNPKFKVRPILRTIQEWTAPMRKELDWGFSHPYMITGQMNRHPRDAMKWREGECPDDCLTFYDQLLEED